MNGLRVPTTLAPELEELVQRAIGACLEVHRALGPGLLENVYSRAVVAELEAQGIPFELERLLPVTYRGQLLCHYRLDVLIDRQLILEIKAVERLGQVHEAQVINYLRLAGLRVGLLMNFNVALLKHGIRRIVL